MFLIRFIRVGVVFAIALVCASTALGQACGRGGYTGNGSFGMGRMGYGGGGFVSFARSGGASRANSNVARLQARARQLASARLLPSSSPGEGSYESMYGGSLSLTPWELERQRKMQLAEQRRDEEKSRREKSRDTIPVRLWSEEQLAESKFKVAHMLYLDGNSDAAKGVLSKLLDEYPDTVTADRAKVTLARL
jgi:hypothetical protein